MKKLSALIVCLNFAAIVVAQQLPPDSNSKSKPVTIRICTPRRGALLTSQPLMVIHARQDTYVTTSNTTGMSSINPDWIETVNILRDSVAIRSYGEAAKAGVVEVTLKDQYYPKAYEQLKELLKQSKIRKLK